MTTFASEQRGPPVVPHRRFVAATLALVALAAGALLVGPVHLTLRGPP